ncbi:DUF302 domain-containing protein [Persephonella atlantica]|uniref:DUF302 domain-containing protein n=2 Tax=Persephonella atlantica TaxID=2699429 RepID=A0ABS1GIC4_9AQUI|nr:DUF302 domain-containing protein [Persephonella atlantica]
MLLLVFSVVYSYEDFVQYEKGYYYVVINRGSFENVNSKLIEEITLHGWDVIHTINVDKTTGIKTPYKTHLLCKSKYLKKGLEKFKSIGVIIPCKMAIFVEGNTIKIMVEDVTEYAKIYRPEDKEFYRFLSKVKDEMIDILNKTAGRFMKSRYTPYE